MQYQQPASEAAWKPPYLEYQFACSAPKKGAEQVLAAEEYSQGHLDWYSFDFAPGNLGGPPDPGEQVAASSFLPTPVTFQGMPDPRWWALEDSKTDFGAVKPSTTTWLNSCSWNLRWSMPTIGFWCPSAAGRNAGAN